MAGVLRAEQLWVESFTGLRVEQFGRLLKTVRERGGDGCRWGRLWRLPLADRVLLVAVCDRTNLTMRQLGPLFGVSAANVQVIVDADTRLTADSTAMVSTMQSRPSPARTTSPWRRDQTPQQASSGCLFTTFCNTLQTGRTVESARALISRAAAKLRRRRCERPR